MYLHFQAIKTERRASLIVLPPLVLGYDDIYDDSKTYNALAKGDGDNHEKEQKHNGKSKENQEHKKLKLTINEHSKDKNDKSDSSAELLDDELSNERNATNIRNRVERSDNDLKFAGKFVLPEHLFNCPYHNHKRQRN